MVLFRGSLLFPITAEEINQIKLINDANASNKVIGVVAQINENTKNPELEEQFGLNAEIFENYKVHVHVPEGATPKDGPSAGIAMLTSILSSFTQRKVKKNLAMTGEITLRGKVLPVGGIKEKILAAKRANIKEIILCKENKKDVDEIKPAYLTGLTFHYVDRMSEVIELALTPH
ncbi:hypothetical protein FQR65_LT19590 [Abscondita terminalis]|nr:hypothetical protein FQR65_LT19590 [Abscondita terminalis]